MTKVNYQKELDKTLEAISGKQEVPTLLLHSCCAPCSSYVLSYLADFFSITVFYYNPNIYPDEEYEKREGELRRLIDEMPLSHPVSFLEGEYDPEKFEQISAGLEQEKEGGERCALCYELRLNEAARKAKEGDFDYFTTTLTVSPYKNADKLNEIGLSVGEKYGVPYLTSDFKKKNGYQISIQLSAKYGLYRQDYCGCRYSYAEREKRKEEMAQEIG